MSFYINCRHLNRIRMRSTNWKKACHMVAVHMCKFTVIHIIYLFSHVLNHNYGLQNHQEKKRRRCYLEAWKKHQQVHHVKLSSIREQKLDDLCHYFILFNQIHFFFVYPVGYSLILCSLANYFATIRQIFTHKSKWQSSCIICKLT